MPNTQRSDFVPVHAHSPDDINGIARYITGSPTVVKVGTTSGPTITAATFVDLEEMTAALVMPTDHARYQVTARFSGEFAHTAAFARVAVKLVQDGTDIPATSRSASPGSGGGNVSLNTFATVEVAGGATSTIKVQWSNVSAAGTATATTTQRRIEYDIRPITGPTP